MTHTITPSSMDPWTGRRETGARFTNEQMHTMRVRARGRPLNSWETRMVKVKRSRPRTDQERAWGVPAERCVEDVEIECPLVSRGADKDWIITPGGEVRAVSSEGKKRK